eukprot:g52674.t1
MCCGKLTAEAKSKNLAFVSFLKKLLLPGVMGTTAKDVPSWSMFIGKDYNKRRHYILAVIQHMTKENFPTLPFALEVKHSPEAILSCIKRHKQSAATTRFCMTCNHPRPWDENGDDLDWEDYVPCQADYCTQPLPRVTDVCTNCSYKQQRIAKVELREQAHEMEEDDIDNGEKRNVDGQGGGEDQDAGQGKDGEQAPAGDGEEDGPLGRKRFCSILILQTIRISCGRSMPVLRGPCTVSDGHYFDFQLPCKRTDVFMVHYISKSQRVGVCMRARVMSRGLVTHSMKHKYGELVLARNRATLKCTYDGQGPDEIRKKFVKLISHKTLLASYKRVKDKSTGKKTRAFRPLMYWDFTKYIRMDFTSSVLATHPAWWIDVGRPPGLRMLEDQELETAYRLFCDGSEPLHQECIRLTRESWVRVREL